MKKVLCFIVLTAMLLSLAQIPALALDTISDVKVSVEGFTEGTKKSDVKFSVSDDRLEITSASINNSTDEGDTLLVEKSYSVAITIKPKSGVSAKFAEGFSKNNVTLSGVDASFRVTAPETGKFIMVTFSAKPSKSAETIAKEEAAEAAKHKHCYCGGDIEIAEHLPHKTVTFTPWDGKSKITYNSNGVASVYLTQDVKIEKTFTVPGGKTINLCMNGFSFGMVGFDRVININTNGTLRLCDCAHSLNSTIYGGENEYGGAIHVGGTFEMFGGIITENYGGYGGGVYNNNKFYLFGGDIYNNKGEYGGGVWNNNDSSVGFIMYEGSIHQNTAGFAGGVWCNDKSSTIIKGGTILNNVSAGAGGGLYLNGKATLEMTGGAISENFARWGGGIWNNGGTIFLKDAARISYNTASINSADFENHPDGFGGGIWNNDKGIVYMSGGELTFNKAGYGGGVWCNPDSEFIMTGGVIADNIAEIGGGVFIKRDEKTGVPGTLRLLERGGVVYNAAYEKAGGVYAQGNLVIDGEGEIIINRCENEEYADLVAEPTANITFGKANPTKFIDVSQDAYYLEPVKWAVENNITSGTSEMTFSPDDKCTRGQVVTFLYRMHGSPETDGFYFADTNPSDYFYDATRWAWELKMERTNAFSPNHNCTREAAIRYMWIAAGSPEPKSTSLPFTDVAADAKYKKAVAWALEKGITTGTTETTFSPIATCTRAQIITFLYRAFR